MARILWHSNPPSSGLYCKLRCLRVNKTLGLLFSHAVFVECRLFDPTNDGKRLIIGKQHTFLPIQRALKDFRRVLSISDPLDIAGEYRGRGAAAAHIIVMSISNDLKCLLRSWIHSHSNETKMKPTTQERSSPFPFFFFGCVKMKMRVNNFQKKCTDKPFDSTRPAVTSTFPG